MGKENHESQEVAVRDDFLQMMPMEQATANLKAFKEFVGGQMVKGLDFGEIPGTGSKASLFKPGAEKLRFIYGIGTEMDLVKEVNDRDGGFLDFTYRCTARSPKGQILAQCEGSCNSDETKFGYLWKSKEEIPPSTDMNKVVKKVMGDKLSEFAFAIDKAETSGKYGKPQAYWQKWKDAIANGTARQITRKSRKNQDLKAWELDEEQIMYRIKNPDIFGLKNTMMKMAQKRAFVGAILLATGASEFFTQDIEDMDKDGRVYSDEHPVPESVDDNGYIHYEEVTTKQEPVTSQQQIPGRWYALMEKCKTPQDIDDIAIKNQEEVKNNVSLRTWLSQQKARLRKQTVEIVDQHLNEIPPPVGDDPGDLPF